MLGLALEGGGAKGAYEIGAYRALTELGYHFDVICGVSIGAINAALLAQGDCEKAAEFWETTANDDLFSEEDKGFLEIINNVAQPFQLGHHFHQLHGALVSRSGILDAAQEKVNSLQAHAELFHGHDRIGPELLKID